MGGESSKVSYSPPSFSGGGGRIAASSNISYDAYKGDQLKVSPYVSTTAYHSSSGNGISADRVGVTASYNFMGDK
jgi:hypothetical protein